MKKSIWIVLPIVIIAVVVIAVFIGQRNSLYDQVTQLETEKTDLSRQLDEADIAVKTAQELAEANRVTMEEKVQEAEDRVMEAEGKAQQAVEALSVATAERDTLQANADAAAVQLSAGIRQVQDALDVLGGTKQDEADASVQLAEAKAALAAVTAERDELQSAAAGAALELQQAQDALAIVTGERDQLQAALEANAAQAAEMQALQDSLAAMTAEHDALREAAQAGAGKITIRILDSEGNEALAFEDASAFKLEDLTLDAGTYTIRFVVCDASGEETAHFDVPYVSAASAPEAAPVEQTEEAPAESTENAEADAA